jgi:hypothetical protein
MRRSNGEEFDLEFSIAVMGILIMVLSTLLTL